MDKPTPLSHVGWLGNRIALCTRALKNVPKVKSLILAVEALKAETLHRIRFRREIEAVFQSALQANNYGEIPGLQPRPADARYKVVAYRLRKPPICIDLGHIEEPKVRRSM